jgi:ABC-type sugar transport system ATPase subunit
MSEGPTTFDGPGIHVIATDVDVDDAAELLARLSVPAGAVIEGELALSPFQDAAENLFLGHEPRRFGLVDRARMRREAAEVFARFGLDLRPDGPPEVRLEQRLLFALARLFVRSAQTVTVNADRLPAPSAAGLAALVRWVREGGRFIVVGTRIGPYLSMAQTITAVSDEAHLAVVLGEGGSPPSSADDVVGLFVDNYTRSCAAGHGFDGPVGIGATVPPPGAGLLPTPRLEVEAWTVEALPGSQQPISAGFSLEVQAGEIVALTGRGVRALVASLFGQSMGAPARGGIYVRRDDRSPRVDISRLSTSEVLAAGVSYGSESPLTYDVGILGGIPTSVSGGALKRLAASGLIDRNRAYAAARRLTLPGLAGADDSRAFTEVLQSWSDRGPAVVILDDHPRGYSAERAAAVRALAARGAAVVMAASRPSDMTLLAHRVVVIEAGNALWDVRLADGRQKRVFYRDIVRARMGLYTY